MRITCQAIVGFYNVDGTKFENISRLTQRTLCLLGPLEKGEMTLPTIPT